MRSRLAVTVMVLASSAAFVSGQAGKWQVRGEAIVSCPCRVPCPCRSNAPPSQPRCENLSYVRFREGRYDARHLDGVEFLWAAEECAGPAGSPRKPTMLYFPRPAAPDQIDAVERIMAGEHCAGKKPAEMQFRRVDLTAAALGSVYSIRAGDAIRLEVDLAPGPIPMEPLPALDLWSNTVTYARNITARVDDPAAGLKWDYSGRQANYRTFEASSDLLERGLLLAEFRDDTGRFNEAHRSLIRELHLEVPLSQDDFDRMLAQVRNPARSAPQPVEKAPFGAVGGTVFDPAGQPRSGARLQVSFKASGFAPITVTNPDGRYFIARVPPGPCRLCATTWDGKTAMRGCAPATVEAGAVSRCDLKLAAAPAAH